MRIEVTYYPSEPAWRVSTIDGLECRVVETHYGDHCDANERRYARERANNTARNLARKHNAKIVRITAPKRVETY